MRSSSKNQLLPLFLGLSLACHFILVMAWPLLPQLPEKWRDLKEKTVEIVSPEDLEGDQKPVVQTSRVDQDKSLSDKADYAGEFDQRVDQQTQSPMQGAFREGQMGKVPESPEIPSEGEKLPSPTDKALALKDFMTFGRSPHALSKDIPFGNQTILNTDKVRYASFVNRIADEVYHPWVEAAERAVRDFVSGRRKIEANLYITRLKITLDKEGEVQGIQVLNSCGISELDEAPKKALWEVEPFPNPPHQLMESDGYVRLTYEFQFEWKNSIFNIIPWKI